MFRYLSSRKAQNVIEHILLVVVVIVLLLVFIKRDGIFARTFNDKILKAPLQYLK